MARGGYTFVMPESLEKLRQFISLLECETIPEVLLEQAARVRVAWGPTGDLTTDTSVLPEWLQPSVQQEYDHSRNGEGPSLLRTVLKDMESIDARRLTRKALSPEVIERILFDILFTVVQAFPEPFTKILWQETTAQLWQVIVSTCLPFLAILGHFGPSWSNEIYLCKIEVRSLLLLQSLLVDGYEFNITTQSLSLELY
jgi:hypothetical protein